MTSTSSSFESLPDFRDKSVTFYLENAPMEYAVTLKSPEFELQAGRLFVTGMMVASASHDWSAGARVCVAWDKVAQYMVFESEDDFANRVATHTGLWRRLGLR